MRIELDRALFLDGNHVVAAHKPALMELLLAAREREQHQLVFSQPIDIPSLIATWTPDDELRTVCHFVFNRRRLASAFVGQPPGVTLEVTVNRPESIAPLGDRAIVTPSRAVALVQMPLSLLLENKNNDLAFLRAVIPPGPWRDWFERALAERWIASAHGGGTDMLPQLRKLTDWDRLRTWAMCDAETWYPSDPSQIGGVEPPDGQVRALKALADGDPLVPLTVLKRRAIENYLPMPALDQWATTLRDGNQKAPIVQAIRGLDQHRPSRFNLRHYYHMANGFAAGTDGIPNDYQPFRNIAELAHGLDSRVKKIYAEQIAGRGNPGHWLDDAWFAGDGHGTEITDIVYSIMRRV